VRELPEALSPPVGSGPSLAFELSTTTDKVTLPAFGFVLLSISDCVRFFGDFFVLVGDLGGMGPNPWDPPVWEADESLLLELIKPSSSPLSESSAEKIASRTACPSKDSHSKNSWSIFIFADEKSSS
jgi:hypothetical protein